MKRTPLVLVLVVGVAASCSRSLDTAATSTSGGLVTSTSVDAATTRSTFTATSEITAPTTVPATTTSTYEGPYWPDGTLDWLPEVTLDVPRDGVAAEIPWDEIGPGWLLLGFQALDTADLALYMVDPEDRLYLLGGWRQAHELHDWNSNGSRLLFTVEDRVVVLDMLEDRSLEFDSPVYPYSARFTRPTGRDVVLGHLSAENRGIAVYRTDGRVWSQLLFGSPSPEAAIPWTQPTWLYHRDGTLVVVADGVGIQLLTNLGDVVRRLDAPGLGCRVVRWWSSETVLVTCIDAVYAASEVFECWPDTGRALWEVPLDGSPATPVGPPTGPGGPGCGEEGGYEPPHIDAAQIGSSLVIETAGCCDCGGSLEVHLDSGQVLIPEEVECSPQLIGVRNDNALVLVMSQSRPGHYSAVAEVAPDGSSRLIGANLYDLGFVWTVLMPDRTDR